MLYRREVSSASSINIENDHKIMTMLRRTGCLTLPQYQMRMLNGYNECGDVNRRSQVSEKKIQFSRNVQHLHVKCHHDNETDKDDRPAETIAKTDVAVETKDFPTDKPSPNSTLRRIFNRTNNIIDQTRTELIDAGNSFIATYVKDFLEAELNF
ncbi:uncharacterized protein LOC119067317 [Bradysia coprophila]|uniref:uncharacterized protein LOC119067317 n=1 Tax=Bradysia coprophila TaxID=38358 RepID=UPI00187D8F79|nr:uncharacterized protein LOC119067317 [Bradysia coprophila]